MSETVPGSCCMPMLHNHLMDFCSYVRKNTLLPAEGGIPRPSHCPFWFASSFYVLEAVKNWMMGRLENDDTPNQACFNLVPPPPTEQYHRFTASNRYTAIAQTRSSLSCHLPSTHNACTPKPLCSRLQTTSQKWFVNRFLNRFSAFTLGISKPVQQKPAWEPA